MLAFIYLAYQMMALLLGTVMPAHMWNHGIHAVLEVLYNLESDYYMLVFIYLMYQIMASLFRLCLVLWTRGSSRHTQNTTAGCSVVN